MESLKKTGKYYKTMEVEIKIIVDGKVLLRTRNRYKCSGTRAHHHATEFGKKWASEWGYQYPTVNVKTIS